MPEDSLRPSRARLSGAPLLLTERHAPAADLGAFLLSEGLLTLAGLQRARDIAAGEDVALREILLAEGALAPRVLEAAERRFWRAGAPDLRRDGPDPRLVDALGARRCLRHALVPWRRIGRMTVVVTGRPERFADHLPELQARFGRVAMALAPEAEVQSAVAHCRSEALAAAAETRVPASLSCRGALASQARLAVIALAGMLALGAALAPVATFAVLAASAVLTLCAAQGLKLAATLAMLTRPRPPHELPGPVQRLPVVSILVPLFREREIARHLVMRLRAIDYPSELLDVCLLVEADDETTKATLAETALPGFMRILRVPRGALKTKPRALNYGLDFCRGSIVGVYDAEDAPAPDQIRRVVAQFQRSGPQVACLQGVLDYYNSRSNWLSRCFTIEYAAWFRLVLPGVARLGLPIPLGGTTLFFRRRALEALGGWDAHNVTEDADLGLRLARHGYRTELVATETREEANCRAWPWIKQRSRWLKGYALTWAVHMRRPGRLWRELGPWRFFGVQALFFATVAQFALAPVLWSFWLMLAGVPHPLDRWLGAGAAAALVALFLASELLNIAVGALAVARTRHAGLIPWVPTLHFYYPLATFAALKGLAEMVLSPHYWDKTAHGVFAPTDGAEAPVPAGREAAVGWAAHARAVSREGISPGRPNRCLPPRHRA